MRLCNNRSNLEIGDVLFSGTGTVGEMYVIEEVPSNWNIKEGVYALKPNPTKVLSKYLKYFLSTKEMQDKYEMLAEGGTVKSISMKKMEAMDIQLPSLEHQKKIVEILDRFDSLCNDISTGLPAEIEARQKQYEYYRDKLLTFKEAIAGGVDKNGNKKSGAFQKYYMFGFTGTPIFSVNASTASKSMLFTTGQTFGDQLHEYTIVDAINDKNVLPFRVDYIKTMDADKDIDDEQVWDINREKAFMAPQRISLVTKYILDHFNQKTYRGDKTYIYNQLTNIADVASAERGAVEEIKKKQRVSGFNSIFAVASVPMAKLYYDEFRKQINADPTKGLKIAVIYSYAPNEEEVDGLLDEENPEDTSALDKNSRDFLDEAISDYNLMFHTNYSTDSDQFQNYYKDVSLRMKNKELDLLIVVNMFLTGFDATSLTATAYRQSVHSR